MEKLSSSPLGWTVAGMLAALLVLAAVAGWTSRAPREQRAEQAIRLLLGCTAFALLAIFAAMFLPFRPEPHHDSVVMAVSDPATPTPVRFALAILTAIPLVGWAALLAVVRSPRAPGAGAAATAQVLAALVVTTFGLETPSLAPEVMRHPAHLVALLGLAAGIVLAAASFLRRGWQRLAFAMAGALCSSAPFAGQLIAFGLSQPSIRFGSGLLALAGLLTFGVGLGVGLALTARGVPSPPPTVHEAVPPSTAALRPPAHRSAARVAVAITAVLAVGFVAWDGWLDARTEAQQMTVTLAGQNRIAVGTPIRFLVYVHHEQFGTPIPGARVQGTLEGKGATALELAEVTTDSTGAAVLKGEAPLQETAFDQLRVRVRHGLDRAEVEGAIVVVQERDTTRIVLNTDKPRYQPGQKLRARALVFDSGLRPKPNVLVELTVLDPNGVRVLHQQRRTSKHGIVSTKLELAEGIRLGDYSVEAHALEATTRRQVQVAHYELPRFRASIEASRAEPGRSISTVVSAEYVFGAPVVDADVAVTFVASMRLPSQPPSERTETRQCKTRADGRCRVELPWPAAEDGELEHLTATAVVTRLGSGVQKADVTLWHRGLPTGAGASRGPITVRAVAEREPLVRQVQNRIYLFATDAAGRPVETELFAHNRGRFVHTSQWGIATITEIPHHRASARELRIVAVGPGQKESVARFEVSHEPAAFLLRPAQTYVSAGSPLAIEAFSSVPGPVFVDVVHHGHVVASTRIAVSKGRGEAAVALDPNLVGLIQLNGYRWSVEPWHERYHPGSLSARLVEDVRVVHVGPPSSNLDVGLSFDRQTHQPGQDAALTATVRRPDGTPVVAALGVVGIDKAVLVGYPSPPAWDIGGVGLDDPEPDGPRGLAELPGLAPTEKADPERDEARAAWLATLPRDQTLTTKSGRASDRRIAETRDLRIHRRVAGSFALPLGVLVLLVGAGLWIAARRRTALGAPLFAAGALLSALGALSVDAATLSGAGAPRDAERFDNREGGTGVRARTEEGSLGGGSLPRAAKVAGSRRDGAAAGASAKTGGRAPPRVRQYFPETLLWQPELVTDESGTATLQFPVADSITTWQVSASAVHAGGGFGAAATELRVTQDFFADLRLPPHLTTGDAISVPVSVFNYLPDPQTVELTFEPTDGLRLVGTERVSVRVDPQRSDVALVRVEARSPGEARLKVTAAGPSHADALERATTVHPDGGRVVRVHNRTLRDEEQWQFAIPKGAREDSLHASLKVYPNRLSQVTEGLYGVFEKPHGCFEQTSSTTYPSVLALRLMRRLRLPASQVTRDAQKYIAMGYQQLISFEVAGTGGFSLFGNAPARVPLTAYGLMEFSDMQAVHPVDPKLIERTRQFLLERQVGAGDWDIDPEQVRQTAYVVWALAESGVAPSEFARALDRVVRGCTGQTGDPYALALCANALLAASRPSEARPLIDRLSTLDPNSIEPRGPSLLYSSGKALKVETVALAALALKRSAAHEEQVRELLDWLIDRREPNGTWATTSSTVTAMRALLEKAPAVSRADRLTVWLNDSEPLVTTLEPGRSIVHQELSFNGALRRGDNSLRVSHTGTEAVRYQLVSGYFLPWKDYDPPPPQSPLSLEVEYGPRTVARGELVTVTVRLGWKGDKPATMPLVEVGLPPGMEPVAEDLDRLQSKVARHTIGPRHVTLYFERLAAPVELEFRLLALLPMRAKAAPSFAYLYYEPETRVEVPPPVLTVR